LREHGKVHLRGAAYKSGQPEMIHSRVISRIINSPTAHVEEIGSEKCQKVKYSLVKLYVWVVGIVSLFVQRDALKSLKIKWAHEVTRCRFLLILRNATHVVSVVGCVPIPLSRFMHTLRKKLMLPRGGNL
ncbi:MAG: hypothetical protein SV375_17205, partial [Thermodesulfobacteriota bacterium]|nr:hypothetical protein [Thermodesulfobacteriota bacterium]